MESLPTDIILKFNPDTLEAVRKEFNLDTPGRVDEAIDLLDDWVKKQAHFKKKDFTREYLECTLISCKGSVERSKIRLDKLCTFKTLLPDFFKNLDVPEDYLELHSKFITHAHLPKITPDNYRVYMSRLSTKDGIDSALIFTYYKYVIMASEYMKMHEYSNGYILVFDYTEANLMNVVAKTNIVELRQALTLLMEGYGMRLKALHIISPSKAITALVSLLKQVLSEKLGGRIHSHKTIDTLYEYVPQSVMPKEYGGEDERTLKMLNEEWLKIFTSKEYKEYIKEMNEAKTIESYRPSDKFVEQCVGMPGSFRTLSVD